MESSPTPLDQTFAQATLPAQTTFDPGHPAVISLVIIAKKMQQAVKPEYPQLDLDGVPGLPGLSPRNSARNHDFAEKTGFVRAKREHVRGSIPGTVSRVQMADTRI